MVGPRGSTDTIIALASGAGRAGIAVVRVSGPGALGVLAHFSTESAPAPRHASIRKLMTDQGELLDEAIVLVFPAPHSYTGQDVVELHLHGGPAIVEAVLASSMKSRILWIDYTASYTSR